jgi:hypothetical protein
MLPKVIKMIARNTGSKRRDEILQSRNDRLNRLSDKYVSGDKIELTEELIDKYRKELHKLFEETLYLEQTKRSIKKDPDINITVNQDQYGSTRSVSRTPVDRDSIMGRYIGPFLVLLKLILVKGVHILVGTTMGANRRDFELAFDNTKFNPEDVAKDPFRLVIFKHKWPSHGYEVKSLGSKEANEFIDAVIEFLAHNPKYLSIRV